ncbi:type IV pilin N-terminal domain-containing protein [Methanosarcina sp. UBA5]|uniref:type IV pilin N-terminal domain-containing protein n=1 Tax=Methanosarcina sp. UBA5 TaxID=1915593 RepID=UPI0025D322E1|nr:type IV pilin N-terminal domain-containing protein [Methanosarcina sp. UBA5]
MEGEKRWTLWQDCRGVSEVYGQLLMISIVVIAFATIGTAVFSDGGAVKPEHIPHTDLQENVDTYNDTVRIVHSGGETIDLSAIKIILFVDEQPTEFSMSEEDGVEIYDPDGNESKDGAFTLGDCIVIDTKEKDLDLVAGANIDMFFVDTPSQQVVQRTVLQKSYGKIPDWITPHPYGSVYDNSTDPGEWLPTELVDGINDGFVTECQMHQGEWSSETFTFGIDADDMNIKNPLKVVLLKIVYSGHDSSMKNLTLEINDGKPDQWIVVDYDMDRYNSYTECDQKLEPYDLKLMNLGVNTTEELENLSVRFSAYGQAASENKIGWVDFIGIHVEY